MKRYAALMLVALMLLVAAPGFGAPDPEKIDPGALTGSFDILVGQFRFGITACCSDDVVSLDLDSTRDFNWGTISDVDGMFIRTTEDSGSVSGSFDIFNAESVNITFDISSEDFFGFDVDALNKQVSFDVDGDLVTGPNGIDISWDFSNIGKSRFVFNQILATIDDNVDGFSVGALRIDENAKYTVAVLAVNPDGEEGDPEPVILGIESIDDLNEGIKISYPEEVKDFPFTVFLQNWSTEELVTATFTGKEDGEYVQRTVLADDFTALVNAVDFGVTYPVFSLFVADDTKIGSGITSFFTFPEDPDGAITIGEFNGKFDITFSSPDAKLSINLVEEGTETGGSSSGCSLGFLAPSALILLAPLMVLLKK